MRHTIEPWHNNNGQYFELFNLLISLCLWRVAVKAANVNRKKND